MYLLSTVSVNYIILEIYLLLYAIKFFLSIIYVSHSLLFANRSAFKRIYQSRQFNLHFSSILL